MIEDLIHLIELARCEKGTREHVDRVLRELRMEEYRSIDGEGQDMVVDLLDIAWFRVNRK